jgi:hypothetical protein
MTVARKGWSDIGPRHPLMTMAVSRARPFRKKLAERKGEQAGAQQYESGYGQREKPVGYKVMVHDTPAILDARLGVGQLSYRWPN